MKNEKYIFYLEGGHTLTGLITSEQSVRLWGYLNGVDDQDRFIRIVDDVIHMESTIPYKRIVALSYSSVEEEE